ncbi:acetate--CoA ligase family protein [Halovivax gelatinilyticus]|uniref:acetate--CoA ligase family protein n=1 Tax=Halovivax gelatinilyticus TaxID=2961597 RepID=UPI0020CA98C8|nr:acetate--CoA ligase [Halovivax gelatinilyticus]
MEPPKDDGSSRVRPAELTCLGPRRIEGTVAIDQGAADARVELSPAADPIVGTELVRQLVADRLDRSDDSEPDELRITGPVTAVERADAEFDEASRLEREAGTDRATITVDLTATALERLTVSPANRSDVPAERDLSALFDPDRIAVVGATDREGSIGRVLVSNLTKRFDGDVIPVTPNYASVRGVPAVESVEDVSGRIDLAVVVLPGAVAIEAVESIADAGVDTIALLSAGFAEAGAEGTARERRLRALVDERDLTLVGPNALGVLSTRSGLNASFGPTLPAAGSVSIVSHSGAMITSLLDWASSVGLGVRDVASVGNGAGVDTADLLAYWGRDPETTVICAYLEDVADGRRFVEVARDVARTTPIVALKSGTTDTGATAAASHTAALVGDDAGFDCAFDAANVIRVETETELTDTISLLSDGPLPSGDRVAIVTNAGGPGVLAADAVDRAGLDAARLSEEATDSLGDRLPDAAAIENPIDVLGDADVDRFRNALKCTLADPGVDAAIVLTTPHPLVSRAELARAIGDCRDRYAKPVVSGFLGGDLPAEVADALASAGVPNYPDVERAARALSNAAAYAESRLEPDDGPVRTGFDETALRRAVERGRDRGADAVGVDGLSALTGYGIETPESAVVTDPTSAREVAESIGGPLVCKLATGGIAHKTDLGGVVTDVPVSDVTEAVANLQERASTAAGADKSPVLIQQQIDADVECLAGVTRHPRFGPMVTFGLGGVLVEQVEDVAHALAPLTTRDARSLCDAIEASDVLDGVRGRPAIDRDALERALVGLSWLAVDAPEIEACEINPLLARPDGVYAVDFHAELADVCHTPSVETDGSETDD